ncbi:outer membrane protein [Bradyrhizobium sp. AUGA SZCCT0283]|uniref:outer membrane protein n=1 Tax=Bradyrhizobium sp. AUGA SZCCT0283 TaxID=2807671 RepID=UPI001BA77B90|nr:outer membrane beta-barrel protein [Bradyrhizobium sp. AUGA SZCCT0283]MBR1274440.1 porin family protein [Bradyrhizobium sp. AUGA SZCCT0283]
MKKYLLATALVGLGSAPTIAADLAARPYTKAPALAAVYDWTGFYIGVNAGVGLGRDRFQHDFLGVGSVYSFYVSPQGGFAGGQVGYNWQTGSVLGPIVFGVEADIQGAGLSDDRTTFNEAVVLRNYNQKLDWFGTARGRIGIANGPVLSYVTAGFAYANVKTSASATFGGVTNTFSNERTQGGWVVGSGVEAALGGNWTGKIEYLYLNLGNKSDIAALAAATPINTELRENIFRVGLNYRIGGRAYAPVAAANWAGFYLGGNFGSGTGRDRSTLNLPAVGFFQAFNLAPDGINGGVQAGYNWQAANWVFGLEADIQGSTQQDNKTCVLSCIPGGVTAAYDATLPWFGTVRGRLGYSVGSTLFYATGGLAYGSIKTKIDTNSFVGPVTQSFSHTNTGWTAGAGIETPFTLLGLLGPNWTTKTEYLYVDLGSTSDSFVFGAVPATTTRSVTEHVFRTGINYHFNSPVVAKY